jgi:hypothetical protein
MTDTLQERLFKEQQSSAAFDYAADQSRAYVETIADRPPFPGEAAIDKARAATAPLPATGVGAEEAVRAMREAFETACVNAVGGRYFGFVTGGVAGKTPPVTNPK